MYGPYKPCPLGDIFVRKKTDQKNPGHEPWSVGVNLLTSFFNVSPNDDDDTNHITAYHFQ